MRSNEIHPGNLVAGKYRVRAILGRSRGLLVDAFHTEFDQRVVIKLLPPSQADDKEVERFRREARTLAKLESEHVARIIDVGTDQSGAFFLVRQYLEGTDLGTHVRKRGALPLNEAVLLILQAAEAVAETHSHNIIIRELKPSDLFLTTRAGGAPLLKLIDFGTAKLMRDSSAPGAELTATTMFGLSPYSSPELMRKAKHVDVRTDIWSLGAIFYEMLTGRPPFAGEAAALMLSISRDEPPPPSHVRPDLPAELDNIIGWCLAKDVDGRFRNVHAFAHALTPYARGEGEVLIQRIGQTTEHAKKRRKEQAAAAPSQPAYVPPPQSATSEESATQLRSPAAGGGAQGPFAASTGRTMPFPGGPSQVPGAMPSGRASQAGSLPPPLAPPAGPSAAVAMPARDDQAGAEKSKRARMVVFGLMAVIAVIVPVLVAVLFLTGDNKKTEGDEATADSGPIAVPLPPASSTETVASAAPTETASAAPTDSAAPAPPPTTTAVADNSEPAAKSTSGSTAPTGTKSTTTSSGGSSGTKTSSGGTATSSSGGSATSSSGGSSSSGGGKGTLVAVAMGGTCAFSVNGAGKGTSSSIRVALPPGRYTVTCKPSSGAAKSKSVAVTSGGTAMATFRL